MLSAAIHYVIHWLPFGICADQSFQSPLAIFMLLIHQRLAYNGIGVCVLRVSPKEEEKAENSSSIGSPVATNQVPQPTASSQLGNQSQVLVV